MERVSGITAAVSRWGRLPGAVWLAALLVAMLCLVAPVSAQSPARPGDSQVQADAPGEPGVFAAPVIIDGNELFQLRGTSAMPAEARAQTVADRIREVATASDATTVRMEFTRTALGTGITADGVLITIVTEADARLEEMEAPVLAHLQSGAIEAAILAFRAERTDEALLGNALEAAAWTVAFVLFTAFLWWFSRRLRRKITELTQRYFQGVESATNEQVQAQAVAALIRYGLNFLLLVIFFLGLYYYLSFALLTFPETRPVALVLLKHVTTPVLNVVLGIIGFLPNLTTLAVIALVAWYVIKGLRVFFDAVLAGTFHLENFEAHWIDPTFNIVRAVIIMIALVFAFPYIPGSDSRAFQGLTILVGAMLSLGSNSVMGNIIAGLFVIYRRSTSIGDRIAIGDHVGDVIEIKMMETHLKSVKNELISIPNAQLLNSDVINYSKKVDGSGLLVHTTVGIGYEESPDKVEAMLIEAARRTKGLKTRPGPFVLWTALADFAINYQVNAYSTRGASIPQIRSDLHRNIVEVFNENRVQIMTPSYHADPNEPKIPAAAWDGVLARSEDS
ncbi:mechanosensitive ion channel family protein [Seohaeicola saemankumensis]|nr:mechanosensitive ion channel domain-containing protein [Seohaeicola saemankumensis]MCA0872358.1 mechanosensitive ion channel family protein [Seohaeicola saemankumensis]